MHSLFQSIQGMSGISEGISEIPWDCQQWQKRWWLPSWCCSQQWRPPLQQEVGFEIHLFKKLFSWKRIRKDSRIFLAASKAVPLIKDSSFQGTVFCWSQEDIQKKDIQHPRRCFQASAAAPPHHLLSGGEEPITKLSRHPIRRRSLLPAADGLDTTLPPAWCLIWKTNVGTGRDGSGPGWDVWQRQETMGLWWNSTKECFSLEDYMDLLLLRQPATSWQQEAFSGSRGLVFLRPWLPSVQYR